MILREVRKFLDSLDERLDQLATPEEKVAEGFAFTVDAIRSQASC